MRTRDAPTEPSQGQSTASCPEQACPDTDLYMHQVTLDVKLLKAGAEVAWIVVQTAKSEKSFRQMLIVTAIGAG